MSELTIIVILSVYAIGIALLARYHNKYLERKHAQDNDSDIFSEKDDNERTDGGNKENGK